MYLSHKVTDSMTVALTAIFDLAKFILIFIEIV